VGDRGREWKKGDRERSRRDRVGDGGGEREKKGDRERERSRRWGQNAIARAHLEQQRQP